MRQPDDDDLDFPVGVRNALLISITFWIAVFFVVQWAADWLGG